VVAALLPGEEIPVTDRIFNEEEAVRRLIGRFADRSVLRCCSEAGPGGYDLFRLLRHAPAPDPQARQTIR
jgi:transposase